MRAIYPILKRVILLFWFRSMNVSVTSRNIQTCPWIKSDVPTYDPSEDLDSLILHKKLQLFPMCTCKLRFKRHDFFERGSLGALNRKEKFIVMGSPLAWRLLSLNYRAILLNDCPFFWGILFLQQFVVNVNQFLDVSSGLNQTYGATKNKWTYVL